MGKFFRALLAATAATVAAYVVMATAGKAGREQVRAKRPEESAEVEADDLPEPIREKLVAELDGHV